MVKTMELMKSVNPFKINGKCETNSMLASSYSLTLKIPIDLTVDLFSVCQFRFTGGGGQFTMSFPAKMLTLYS
jgi:hypothetical protein